MSSRDDQQAVLEAADLVVGRVAEGDVLRVVPPTPEAEDQPAAADVVERRRHLGQERRIPVLGGHDEDPELGLRVVTAAAAVSTVQASWMPVVSPSDRNSRWS